MKHLLFRAATVAVVLLGLSTTSQALADNYSMFVANGTFADGSVLGGTLTIDETTGVPSAENMTVSALGDSPFEYIHFFGSTSDDSQYYINSSQSSLEFYPVLSLIIPTSGKTTLIGYDGGALASDANCCAEPYQDKTGYNFADGVGYDLISGSLTPISAAPEPSAWALMIAGVSVAGLALRRRRNGAALAAG